MGVSPLCGNTYRRTRAASLFGAVSSKLPVSAMFLFAQPILGIICWRPRGKGDFAHVDASALVQVAFVALAGLWLLGRLRNIARRLPAVLYSPPVVYLVGYLVLAGVSVLWSNYLLLTLYRTLEACVYLGLILYTVLAARNVKEAFALLIIYCMLAAGGEVFACIRNRLALGESSIISLLHANVAPAVASVGLFLCWLFIRDRLVQLAAWFSAAIIVVTTSVSTYAAILVTIFVILLCRASAKARAIAFLVFGLIVVVGLVLGSFSFLADALLYGKTDEAIEGGSGRLAMWEYYWDNVITDSPWLGQGYVAGEHQHRHGESYYTIAHNVFIAAAAGLGVLGAAICLLLAGSMLYRSSRIIGPVGVVLLAASLCIWLNSLMMPGISGRAGPMWLVIAWLCVLVGTIWNGHLVPAQSSRDRRGVRTSGVRRNRRTAVHEK
ncbi:MAG: O-antigen ligase family protein [Planctomycetota bacterium]|nr:O-antigen ligase family protein [Planctomycetota bacterium]